MRFCFSIIFTIIFISPACISKRQEFFCQDIETVIDESENIFSAIDKLTHWHDDKYIMMADEKIFALSLKDGSVLSSSDFESEEFANSLLMEIKQRYNYIDFFTDSEYNDKIKDGEKQLSVISIFPISKDSIAAIIGVLSPYKKDILNDSGVIEYKLRKITTSTFLTYLNKDLNVIKHIQFSSMNFMDYMSDPLAMDEVPYVHFYAKGFSIVDNSIMIPNLRMKAIEIPAYTLFTVEDEEIIQEDSSDLRFNIRKDIITLKQVPKTIVNNGLIFIGNTLFDTDIGEKHLLPWTDSLWVEDIIKKGEIYYVLCFNRINKTDKKSKEAEILLYEFNPQEDLKKTFIGNYNDIKRGCLHSTGYSLIYVDDEEKLRLSNNCF